MERRVVRRSRSVRGFSSLEFTNGLSALALLATASVGGVRDFVVDVDRTTVTNQMLAGLRAARSAAHQFSTVVTICPSTDGRTCSPRSDWGTGWVAFVDADGNGEMARSERRAVVARAVHAAPHRVAVSSEWDRFSFAPGRPVEVAEDHAAATLCIRDGRGREQERVIWIDRRGFAQVRDQRPAHEREANAARDFSQRLQDCY